LPCGPAAPACAAAISAEITGVDGGKIGDIVKSFALTYVQAEGLNFIGGANWSLPTKVVASGLVGGAVSAGEGGKFLPGFLAAGFSSYFTSDLGWAGRWRGPVAIVLGGASSVLGGGKFANGAITAAFAYAATASYREEREARYASNDTRMCDWGPCETVVVTGHHVTVNYFYDELFLVGHLGLSVDGRPSRGFYPNDRNAGFLKKVWETAFTTPGSFQNDDMSYGHLSVDIPITGEQADEIQAYLDTHQGAYNSVWSNCVDQAEVALWRAGVFIPPAVVPPAAWLQTKLLSTFHEIPGER
jgi:hypothetical protein